MAIAFVAAGTQVSTFGTGTAGLTVTVADGTDGNFMLLISSRTDDAGTYDAISGWQSIGELVLSDTGGGDRQCAVYSRIASSEPASYNLTHTDTANQGWGAVILEWSGVDSTNSLDTASQGDATQFNQDDGTPPAITTVTNNAWVVVFGTPRAFSAEASSFTPPSGYTERADISETDFKIHVSDKAVATAGSETPGAIVANPGGSNINDWLVGTLALRPDAGGGSGVSPTMYMGRQLGKALIQ